MSAPRRVARVPAYQNRRSSTREANAPPSAMVPAARVARRKPLWQRHGRVSRRSLGLVIIALGIGVLAVSQYETVTERGSLSHEARGESIASTATALTMTLADVGIDDAALDRSVDP